MLFNLPFKYKKNIFKVAVVSICRSNFKEERELLRRKVKREKRDGKNLKASVRVERKENRKREQRERGGSRERRVKRCKLM